MADVISVSIIEQIKEDSPARYGAEVLSNSLEAKGARLQKMHYWAGSSEGISLVIGTTHDRLIQKLLEENRVQVPCMPESVIYWWCRTENGKVLVAAGTDDRGLQYALLELAQRVEHGGLDALSGTGNLIESPDNQIRSVSRFVMSSRDDGWFYSEEFWHYYMRRLVSCRFNRFVLILGFDTPYFSPPYPFFVDVPGYPEVKAIGLTQDMRQRNLAMLRKIGQICRSYGVEYNLATWQQTLWNDNQKPMVTGLVKDEDAFGDYCAVGLKALLNACPEIDVLQLRVNHEAGVGTQETNVAFWKKMIAATAQADRKVKLDLRAKGLTDDMIRYAQEQGLELAVPTKYWCEHIALPYHISKMRTEELERLSNFNHSRRYSYADMLRKPRFYDIIYRLWNYGSNTIFLWGDPDYVRRFSASMQYGGAVGYEVTAPLSLKGGQASYEGEDWPIYKDRSLIHYRWEDERYWAYYLFFGRLGYSEQTDEEVWTREFSTHFGQAAPAVEKAYRSASKILPLITTFHMPIHPSLSYWIEMSTGAALFGQHNYNQYFKEITYQDSEPSDSGLFYGISEYVRDLLGHKVKGRYTPPQVSRWLTGMAEEVQKAVAEAEEALDLSNPAEFTATKTDMLMLADLALYHANKTRAALSLSLYERTNKDADLLNAYHYAVLAGEYWQALSDKGGVYQDDLNFGVGGVSRRYHWRDRLPEIGRDIAKLKEMLVEKGLEPVCGSEEYSERSSGMISYRSSVPAECRAGEDLVLNVELGEITRLAGGLTMHYRHMNQLEGYFKTAEMRKTDKGYCGVIPGEYITPEWDLMVYFSCTDQNGDVHILPGVYHSAYPAPYHVIKTA